MSDMLLSGTRDGLGGQVRDLDEGKREALVEIPWERIDSYRTDFAKDCFDEFLGERMPVMCWQHDKKEPIGRAVEHAKNERAAVHEFRLRFSDFDAVPRARQAFTQWQDGDLTDVSFYYDQATAMQHPNGERGALRFTKARMPEISPVTVGSIPGAVVTGVRSEADLAGVAELVRGQVITPDEGRTLLGLAGSVPSIEPVRQEREQIVAGQRAVTITIGADGEVTGVTGGDTMMTAAVQADDGDDVATTLAQAVDAALDGYSYFVASIDRTGLDPDLQQALSLADAAAVTVDSLLDEMGVDDPDDDQDFTATGEDGGDGGRAAEDDNADPDASGERTAVPDESGEPTDPPAALCAEGEAGERTDDEPAEDLDAIIDELAVGFASIAATD